MHYPAFRLPQLVVYGIPQAGIMHPSGGLMWPLVSIFPLSFSQGCDNLPFFGIGKSHKLILCPWFPWAWSGGPVAITFIQLSPCLASWSIYTLGKRGLCLWSNDNYPTILPHAASSSSRHSWPTTHSCSCSLPSIPNGSCFSRISRRVHSRNRNHNRHSQASSWETLGGLGIGGHVSHFYDDLCNMRIWISHFPNTDDLIRLIWFDSWDSSCWKRWRPPPSQSK